MYVSILVECSMSPLLSSIASERKKEVLKSGAGMVVMNKAVHRHVAHNVTRLLTQRSPRRHRTFTTFHFTSQHSAPSPSPRATHCQ